MKSYQVVILFALGCFIFETYTLNQKLKAQEQFCTNQLDYVKQQCLQLIEGCNK